MARAAPATLSSGSWGIRILGTNSRINHIGQMELIGIGICVDVGTPEQTLTFGRSHAHGAKTPN
jgi:hypothetical protein